MDNNATRIRREIKALRCDIKEIAKQFVKEPVVEEQIHTSLDNLNATVQQGVKNILECLDEVLRQTLVLKPTTLVVGYRTNAKVC